MSTTSSSWRMEHNAPVLAVGDEAVQRELAAAIAQARATAEQARQRWNQAAPEDRDRWAVKWATPLAGADNDTRVEHVWVKPVNWSPVRIEGILVSQPVNPMAGGKRLGDLVGFPIDELSDWVHFTPDDTGTLPGGDFSGPHEGGFTVKVLEQRYGTPQKGGQ